MSCVFTFEFYCYATLAPPLTAFLECRMQSIVATMPTLPTLTWNTTVPLESSPPCEAQAPLFGIDTIEMSGEAY